MLSALAVLAAARAEWWQKRYTDSSELACAIYHQTQRFERSRNRAETLALRRELAGLLGNTDTIFADKDGTIITVRDAAADVVQELGDPVYWSTSTYHPVKLLACCPLPEENDCARIHIAAYDQADFDELRQILLDKHR